MRHVASRKLRSAAGVLQRHGRPESAGFLEDAADEQDAAYREGRLSAAEAAVEEARERLDVAEAALEDCR